MDWIKCSDKLPEDGKYAKYLIVVKWLDTIMDKGEFKSFVDTAYFNTFHKLWINDNDSIVCDDENTTVTHWMPLPQAPEG